MYNLNSDNEKKEKAQEICKGLISEEEIINDIKNNNEMSLIGKGFKVFGLKKVSINI